MTTLSSPHSSQGTATFDGDVPALLHALLGAIPDPARIVNPDGAVLAQNAPAQSHGPSSEQSISERELTGGVRLETWKTPRASDPDLRALANGLAHTLRNPLSSIMTAADLVKDDKGVSEESAMLLGIIAKESRQLNRILTDFLNYVRPRPNPPARFDLAKALRDTIAVLKREDQLPEGVQVHDELPAALPAWGDEVAIRQALRNIVQNAVEASGEKAELHLSGEMVDESPQVSVVDNGGGFSEESLRRAFEPFYSYRPENAGLGLPVAMAAVERSGGSLKLENLHENGSSVGGVKEALGETSASSSVRGARVCLTLTAPTAPHDEIDETDDNEVVTR